MLEVLLMRFIIKKIKEDLTNKGYEKHGKYIAIFVCFWFGFEIMGAIIGLVIAGGMDNLFFALIPALMGAALGGSIGYMICKNAPPQMVPVEIRDEPKDFSENNENYNNYL